MYFIYNVSVFKLSETWWTPCISIHPLARVTAVPYYLRVMSDLMTRSHNCVPASPWTASCIIGRFPLDFGCGNMCTFIHTSIREVGYWCWMRRSGVHQLIPKVFRPGSKAEARSPASGGSMPYGSSTALSLLQGHLCDLPCAQRPWKLGYVTKVISQCCNGKMA